MRHGEPKKNWSITSAAFKRLLEWLDENADSDGQKYLEIRRRLVIYFDRKNCLMPDELADDTLNRVARRLEEEGKIESETPAKYCYITARFVFMEYLRGHNRTNISLDGVGDQAAKQFAAADGDAEIKKAKEKMLDCLDRCTADLDALNREIITNYYFGAERIKIENRRALANKLGITINALSIRACRIRDKLEICVRKCAAET